MKEWFSEMLIVLAYSTRTQWAITIGIVFFIGINLLGEHMISNFHMSGSSAFMEDIIKNKLLHRYDKVALFCLISSWVLAFKLYNKDKKKFLNGF